MRLKVILVDSQMSCIANRSEVRYSTRVWGPDLVDITSKHIPVHLQAVLQARTHAVGMEIQRRERLPDL